jgi:tRNA(Ile)-lysidine synthase
VRVAEPTGPIADRELAGLFAPLAKASRIALAVSGGGDSLALLDCADRWRRSRASPPEMIVLSVDHGLAATSKQDAAAVVALARDRGIDAKSLRWTGKKPRSGIEAAARAARYRLLLCAAKQAGASHLLLAHHREDQAETLLMRLARGSGLFGLAAMRPQVAAGEVTIFRPFLGVSRARLAATIAAAGLVPVEDAMNADPRFARVRLRQIMPLLAGEGIDPAGLAATANRLAGAAEAIDAAASALFEKAVSADDHAVASIDAGAFSTAPQEIRLRSLVRILLAVGGDQYPPRFERLVALADAIARHDGRARLKRTLSGTVIEWRRGCFVIYREIGRNGLSEIAVGSGFSDLWDHRFQVKTGSKAPSGLKLAALGEAGRRAIGVGARSAAPGAMAALPAMWRGKTLCAVPTLGYFTRGGQSFGVTVRSILADRLTNPPGFPDFLASI